MNLERMNPENRTDQQDLVTFRLEQQTYALPIEPIVQIIEMVTITPIPQVSNVVEGVINVRGAPAPVVNLRRHLGLPEVALQLHTPIILVQVGKQMVGLIVDEVVDVLSLGGGRIIRPTDILPDGLGEAPILQGMSYVENGVVLLLDLGHLFRPDQVQALVQAMEKLPEVVEPGPGVELGEGVPEKTPTEGELEPTRKRRRKAPKGLPVETQPEATAAPAKSRSRPDHTRSRKRRRLTTSRHAGDEEVSPEARQDEPDQEVGT